MLRSGDLGSLSDDHLALQGAPRGACFIPARALGKATIL